MWTIFYSQWALMNTPPSPQVHNLHKGCLQCAVYGSDQRADRDALLDYHVECFPCPKSPLLCFFLPSLKPWQPLNTFLSPQCPFPRMSYSHGLSHWLRSLTDMHLSSSKSCHVLIVHFFFSTEWYSTVNLVIHSPTEGHLDRLQVLLVTIKF